MEITIVLFIIKKVLVYFKPILFIFDNPQKIIKTAIHFHSHEVI